MFRYELGYGDDDFVDIIKVLSMNKKLHNLDPQLIAYAF
jgi:hypothetical protein